jgi:hypothetical protein
VSRAYEAVVRHGRSIARASPSDRTRHTLESLEPRSLGYLRKELAARRMLLFTGAGFSADARDVRGRPLPSSAELVRELWPICFPGEPLDRTSSLEDVFAHGLACCPRELDRHLKERLTVDPSTLPDHYRLWFEMPWLRIYTINQDDLEHAVAERFDLPRRVKSISALGRFARKKRDPRVLEVVHMNGIMLDGVERVTFSQEQYAERLATREPWYARLAQDLVHHPCVFVGTPLGEPLLWQHLTLRLSRGRRKKAKVSRPRSFLVTRSLPRAREEMLGRYRVEWIEASACDFAERVLARLEPALGSSAADRLEGEPRRRDAARAARRPARSKRR